MPEFCKTVGGECLFKYTTLEEMLRDEFYPGNYAPTKDQACQLIRAATLSAARWAVLHRRPEEVQA